MLYFGKNTLFTVGRIEDEFQYMKRFSPGLEPVMGGEWDQKEKAVREGPLFFDKITLRLIYGRREGWIFSP